jgi:hypothetical protein
VCRVYPKETVSTVQAEAGRNHVLTKQQQMEQLQIQIASVMGVPDRNANVRCDNGSRRPTMCHD